MPFQDALAPVDSAGWTALPYPALGVALPAAAQAPFIVSANAAKAKNDAPNTGESFIVFPPKNAIDLQYRRLIIAVSP